METSTLPDAEFKTMTIRILNELMGTVKELSENFKEEIEDT